MKSFAVLLGLGAACFVCPAEQRQGGERPSRPVAESVPGDSRDASSRAKVASQETTYQGKPLDRWIAQLHEKNPPQARAEAVKVLAVVLREADTADRLESAEALGRIGAEAKPAVPVLAEAVQDNEAAKFRAAAAKTLGSIGPAARSVVPALTLALQDEDRGVRDRAAIVQTISATLG